MVLEVIGEFYVFACRSPVIACAAGSTLGEYPSSSSAFDYAMQAIARTWHT
jgi:hypothetical protein